MEKRKFYVMCGLPGSGKSTWARKHFADKLPIVSRDEVRFKLVREDEDYFSHEDEVFIQFINEIAEWSLQHDVVIDATHINRGSRRKLLNALTLKCGEDIEVYFIWMNMLLATCKERNMLREGRARVPDEALANMWNRMQVPHKNEYGKSIIKGIWFVEE